VTNSPVPKTFLASPAPAGAPRRRRRAASPRAGFSLVELIAAVVILVTAVMTTMRMQLVALDLTKTARETTTAMADLESALEEIFLLPADNIPVAGGGYAPGLPIAKFNDRHLRGERIVPAYPGYVAGGVVPDPLEVVLTATWNDFAGRPRSVRLSSMKAK